MFRPSFSKLGCGLLALALVSPGCKSSEPKATEAVPAPAQPSESADQGKPVQAPPADTAEAPTKATPAPVQAEVHYAATLTSLLDLVPSKDDHFVVVRDPAAALRLFDAFVGSVGPAVLAKEGDDKAAMEAKVGLEAVGKLRDALIEAKVDLDKGMVFLEDSGVLLYATSSDDPSAINLALKAVALDDVEFPPCVMPPSMPGFAACGADDATVAALVPGKHSAVLRAEFEQSLVGFDVERGNALFRLDGPDGPVHGAIATPAGQMHAVLGLGSIGQELGKYLSAGRPQGLGMLAPGAAFLWTQLSLAGFADMIAQAPPPVANVTDTLTGEVIVGGVQGSVASALVGVNDPFPASGLVSLAALQTDALQGQLPAGSTVEVVPVDLGGASTPVLKVEVALDAASKKIADSFGIRGTAFGFSAGKYAGVMVGAEESGVKTVASHTPGPTASAGLPANLAYSLDAGEAAFALYLPFDAMQSATMRTSLAAAVAAASGPDLEDSKLIDLVYDMISPLSSVSIWLTHPANARVLHVSIEGFGDTETEEGKAALDVLTKVVAGADATETYRGLAAAYPDSPRVLRYRMRAGDETPGALQAAMSSSFLLGVVAGITVPAFVKYVERAREASEELAAAQRAVVEAGEALE